MQQTISHLKEEKETKVFTIKIYKDDFNKLKRFLINEEFEEGEKIKDEDVIRGLFFVQTGGIGRIFDELDLRDKVKIVSFQKD